MLKKPLTTYILAIGRFLTEQKKGQVPCVKVGRRVLFSQEGLDQWIADQEAKSIQQESEPQYGRLRKIKG